MIVQVSPLFYDDPVRFSDRTGWQYRCEACEWRSPVMKHELGALRHENEHEKSCPLRCAG